MTKIKSTYIRPVVFALLGLVLLPAILWFAIEGWRGAPLMPDFTGYKSTVALDGAVVVDTELERIKERGLDIWRFDYIHTYDSGVVVHQRKADERGDMTRCAGHSQGKRGDYVDSCVESTLENGGHYIVTTSTYKGELFSVAASAVIGTTEFYVGIPKEQLEQFAQYDGWQGYFESMEPVSLKFKPYRLKTTTMGG